MVTVLLKMFSRFRHEMKLKIGLYFMKLRRIKLRRTEKCASFWATLYIWPYQGHEKTLAVEIGTKPPQNITKYDKILSGNRNTSVCFMVLTTTYSSPREKYGGTCLMIKIETFGPISETCQRRADNIDRMALHRTCSISPNVGLLCEIRKRHKTFPFTTITRMRPINAK